MRLLPTQFFAGEEKLEVLPSTEADDQWIRDIPGSSGVDVRQQLSGLVDRVDSVFARQVRASEEKLEVLPSTEADDHRVRHIPWSTGIPVRQQLPVLVHRIDAVVRLTHLLPAKRN